MSGALTALVLVATAACGGGDDDPGLPEQTIDASSSVEDVLANLPTEPPKRPDDAFTVAGAEEFAQHVLDMLFYILAVGDGQALVDLDLTGGCSSCVAQRDAMTDTTIVEVLDAEPKTVSLHAGQASPTSYVVVLEADFPAGRKIDRETEKVASTFSEAPAQFLTVTASWTGDRWSLDDIALES